MDTNDSENEAGIDEVFDMRSTKPMVRLQILRRLFPNFDQLIPDGEDEIQNPQDDAASKWRTPNYKMYKTQFRRNYGERTSLCSGVMDIFRQILELLHLRSTWRVLIFGFSTSAVAMNWTFSEMVLPPFLERRFGEYIPIYTIQSINLFGCLIFPPIVGALTSGREDFSVIMPGKCRSSTFLCLLFCNQVQMHLCTVCIFQHRTLDYGHFTNIRGNVTKCHRIMHMASVLDDG